MPGQSTFFTTEGKWREVVFQTSCPWGLKRKIMRRASPTSFVQRNGGTSSHPHEIRKASATPSQRQETHLKHKYKLQYHHWGKNPNKTKALQSLPCRKLLNSLSFCCKPRKLNFLFLTVPPLSTDQKMSMWPWSREGSAPITGNGRKTPQLNTTTPMWSPSLSPTGEQLVISPCSPALLMLVFARSLSAAELYPQQLSLFTLSWEAFTPCIVLEVFSEFQSGPSPACTCFHFALSPAWLEGSSRCF